MLDLTYVLGTVAFFAAMRGYVKACEHPGHPLPPHPEPLEGRLAERTKGPF